MQKFDFLKNGARFYAKITSPTCFPHKITPSRIILKLSLVGSAYIGVKSCEKSIARIPECFLDPDSGKI
jgi:hypothetical protein